jgi:predicted nucleic acid-binding protein
VNRSLLDTNIISKVTKRAPSEALVAWMAEQRDEDLFISSLTIAEIQRGILEKPAGKKRRELERWFAGPEGPLSLFAGRVLRLGAVDGGGYFQGAAAKSSGHDHRGNCGSK